MFIWTWLLYCILQIYTALEMYYTMSGFRSTGHTLSHELVCLTKTLETSRKIEEVTIVLSIVSIIRTRSLPYQKFSLNIQNLLRNLDELKWIFLDCWLNGFLFSKNKYDWLLQWQKLQEGQFGWYSVCFIC